jgi:hypothetical protein
LWKVLYRLLSTPKQLPVGRFSLQKTPRTAVHHHGYRPVLEARAAEVLQPDIGNTGGIMEARKITAMAEA